MKILNKMIFEGIYPITINHIGTALAIGGTALAVIGTLYNNIALSHVIAMYFWMISNPLLLAWAYGSYKKWWNGSISIESLAIMYGVFSITNFYGLIYA